jgi:hypothetical protein
VRVAYDVAPDDTTPPGGGTDTTPPAGTGTTTRPQRDAGGTGTTTRPQRGAGGTGTVAPGSKLGTGGSPFSGTAGEQGGASLAEGLGVARGAQPTFARGTLLDVIPLSGPDGIGLGALGVGAGPDAVALGLLLVGVAYITGVSAGPAVAVVRSVNRLARTQLGRSTA